MVAKGAGMSPDRDRPNRRPKSHPASSKSTIETGKPSGMDAFFGGATSVAGNANHAQPENADRP